MEIRVTWKFSKFIDLWRLFSNNAKLGQILLCQGGCRRRSISFGQIARSCEIPENGENIRGFQAGAGGTPRFVSFRQSLRNFRQSHGQALLALTAGKLENQRWHYFAHQQAVFPPRHSGLGLHESAHLSASSFSLL